MATLNWYRDYCYDHRLWSEILEYKDGELYWKIDILAGRGDGYIRTPQGSKADTHLDADGRPYVSFGKVSGKYRNMGAHRVIWEMFNGPIPEGMEVDHIKEIRETGGIADNHIENLQLLPPAENKRKSCKIKRSNNKSDKVGVHFNEEKGGVWIAQVMVDGKKIWLGQYRTFEEAAAVRDSFESNAWVKPERRVKQWNNTSGYPGVNWDKTHERWVARINIGHNKRICLGYFHTKEEAIAAREAAEEEQRRAKE